MTKPRKWEEDLKRIVPDSDQRQKVIKFIKEYKKEWREKPVVTKQSKLLN